MAVTKTLNPLHFEDIEPQRAFVLGIAEAPRSRRGSATVGQDLVVICARM